MRHTTSALITTRLPLQMRVSACRDPAFQWCVSNCAGGDGCVMLPPAVSKRAAAECTAACPAQFDHPVPKLLRLLRWSCEDDCRCARHRVVRVVLLMIMGPIRSPDSSHDVAAMQQKAVQQ